MKVGNTIVDEVVVGSADKLALGPLALQPQEGLLTADAVTPPDGIRLDLTVKGPNYGSSVAVKQYSAAASTQVIVSEPVIDVTSINLSPTTIVAEVGDNYLTKINELVTVTVLPADATDKSWTASVGVTSTATVSPANVITGPGRLDVTIQRSCLSQTLWVTTSIRIS